MPVVAYTNGWEQAPASGYKYVRRVARPRDRPWQARVPVGPHSGSPRVNLGCYPTPRVAWQAVTAWLKSGVLPCGVLPTYVRWTPDGRYVGQCRRNGGAVAVGPAATPDAVVRLLTAELAELPPKPRRPKRDASPGETCSAVSRPKV